MFLSRWIRRLLSLPFFWLGQISAWILPGPAVLLYGLAWRIGEDGEAAVQALQNVLRTKGPGFALHLAQSWVRQQPCAQLAAFAGLIALQESDDDLAAELLTAGKRAGSDPSGLLDTLDWLVATRPSTSASSSDLPEPPAAHAQRLRRLARQMEARRDLPFPLSRMLQAHLLWDAMQEQRFDEARRRARHMLQIEDMPHAEMAMWALALHDRDESRAAEHLRRVPLAPVKRMMLQVAGYRAIGRLADAEDCTARIEQLLEAQAQPSRRHLADTPRELAQ